MDNKTIQGLKERKSKLETDYQEGLKVFKPAYPKMEQIAGQIAEIDAMIAREIENVRASFKARYQAAKAQETALIAKLQESRQDSLGVQDRSIQYNILKREVDTNRQLFEGLLQRLKEVGVAGGVGTNNISVVDKAEVPGGPHSPNPRRNLMIAIFLGLFGGIGLAFLFEHLDDTVKLAEEMEQQLGLPVLGVIPHTRVSSDEKLYKENFDSRSHFAEAYRSLRTALQFSTAEGMPRVLMVTSTSMGEGKSTTALRTNGFWVVPSSQATCSAPTYMNNGQWLNCPQALSSRLMLTGCGVRSSCAKKLTRSSSSNQRNSSMRASCTPLRSATKRQ
jgi:hypothetical protein